MEKANAYKRLVRNHLWRTLGESNIIKKDLEGTEYQRKYCIRIAQGKYEWWLLRVRTVNLLQLFGSLLASCDTNSISKENTSADFRVYNGNARWTNEMLYKATVINTKYN